MPFSRLMRTSSADDQASRAGPSTLNMWFLCRHCGLDSAGPFLFWSLLGQSPTERFSPKIHPLLGAFQFPKETITFLHVSHPLGKVQTHHCCRPCYTLGPREQPLLSGPPPHEGLEVLPCCVSGKRRERRKPWQEAADLLFTAIPHEV